MEKSLSTIYTDCKQYHSLCKDKREGIFYDYEKKYNQMEEIYFGVCNCNLYVALLWAAASTGGDHQGEYPGRI